MLLNHLYIKIRKNIFLYSYKKLQRIYAEKFDTEDEE